MKKKQQKNWICQNGKAKTLKKICTHQEHERTEEEDTQMLQVDLNYNNTGWTSLKAST